MISDAEIRRIARREGVEPRIIELDYVLGWALRGIVHHPYLAERLVFKGGTCLRKCYFPEYRFSEDLDFTAVEGFALGALEHTVREALQAAGEASDVDFGAGPMRRRMIDDEYGRETLRFTIYWRGPHRSAGSAPGLRLDITRNEQLAFETVRREVLHEFSDAGHLGPVEIQCYSLEEVMTEKVRAILGQRIHAVSRDLYDVFSLLAVVDHDKVVVALPEKLTARGVEQESINLGRVIERRAEFAADWERNLAQLLPPGGERRFDDVWDPVIGYLREITRGLNRNPRRGP